MRRFLAEQDAKQRAVAAIESEPEPDHWKVVADAAPGPAIASAAAVAKHQVAKPIRLAKALAPPSVSSLPPPMALAQMPPPPAADPPPAAHAYDWVHDAARLPRRLWAAVGELMDERPPIPPRPIPPV